MESRTNGAIRDRHDYTRRAAVSSSALSLLDAIRGLRTSTFPDLVVSAYVPVAPDTRWGQPSDALRDLAEERRSALDPEAQQALDRELPHMRQALDRDWRNCAGVAAFSHRGLRLALGLKEVAVPRLVVSEHAELRPLDDELKAHPPSLVVIADKQGARLYAAVLDRVDRLAQIDALPIHRHRQGGTSAEQWQRRQDEHASANMQLVAGRLESIWGGRRDDFPIVRIAAPPEAAELLAGHLPREMQARVRREGGLPAYLSSEEVARRLLDDR